MPITDAPFKPRHLKDISLIIDKATAGATEFRKCIQSFAIVPSSSVSTATGGTPDSVFSEVSPTTYTATVKFLQDAETLGSLTDYLITNQGKRKTLDFVPYGGTGWQITAALVAPSIGGDMNAWLSDTLTFGVIGVPARTTDDVATPQQ